MKAQRFAIGLTLVNLVVLLSVVLRPSSAAGSERPGVLRVSGLELVDEAGRVRALLKVLPAEPERKMPDGSVGYPETVLFRLLNSKGAPNVKISATEDGSGVYLGGESAPAGIQISARGASTSMSLVNKDGRKELVRPGEE